MFEHLALGIQIGAGVHQESHDEAVQTYVDLHIVRTTKGYFKINHGNAKGQKEGNRKK